MDEPQFQLTDFGKMERPGQLHVAFQVSLVNLLCYHGPLIVGFIARTCLHGHLICC